MSEHGGRGAGRGGAGRVEADSGQLGSATTSLPVS